MGAVRKQTTLYRGIYEFEDPSGCLMAARVPQTGSADLYRGTAVTVRPNQSALLVYKGQITDLFGAGLHLIETDNVPALTRLANWKFGFTSPLRCEIWFFSGAVFTGRRWGTASPVLLPLEGLGTVPIRAYGNYSVVVRDPVAFLQNLIGTRSSFGITDAEDYIQGHLVELLPSALSIVKEVGSLASASQEVSRRLLSGMTARLQKHGLAILDLQVLSLLPSQEIVQALDAKIAMQVLGNQKEYLLYKTANSLDALEAGDDGGSSQLLLGMMMAKGLSGADYHGRETAASGGVRAVEPVQIGVAGKTCADCGHAAARAQRFCGHCGKELKP